MSLATNTFSECPICNAHLALPSKPGDRGSQFAVCPRCGPYTLNLKALLLLGGTWRNQGEKFLWATTSHAVRTQQTPGGLRVPILTDTWIQSIWMSQRLPNPQVQVDNFIKYLGTYNAPRQWVQSEPMSLSAVLGTIDDPVRQEQAGFLFIMNHVIAQNLVERRSIAGGSLELRLTLSGWARFQQLQTSTVETKTAFMAMAYGQIGEGAFPHFVKAVEATGFELRRLDQKPRAGLIDHHMRVEIRSAKFLIADLSDANNGAYWESGFAEGQDKKVYYTCEASRFNDVGTHFDTNHLLTIKWSLSNMTEAIDTLKSAIRNDFPTESNLVDS